MFLAFSISVVRTTYLHSSILFNFPPPHTSLYLSLHPSTPLSIPPSIAPSSYSSTYTSIHLKIHQYIYTPPPLPPPILHSIPSDSLLALRMLKQLMQHLRLLQVSGAPGDRADRVLGDYGFGFQVHVPVHAGIVAVWRQRWRGSHVTHVLWCHGPEHVRIWRTKPRSHDDSRWTWSTVLQCFRLIQTEHTMFCPFQVLVNL